MYMLDCFRRRLRETKIGVEIEIKIEIRRNSSG